MKFLIDVAEKNGMVKRIGLASASLMRELFNQELVISLKIVNQKRYTIGDWRLKIEEVKRS